MCVWGRGLISACPLSVSGATKSHLAAVAHTWPEARAHPSAQTAPFCYSGNFRGTLAHPEHSLNREGEKMRNYSESERWDEESRSLSAPSACLVSLVGAKIAYEHHRFLLTELTDIRGGGNVILVLC